MSGRVIAGSVIVLVLVVGAVFLVVGSLAGGDSDKGDRTAPVSVRVAAPAPAGAPAVD
ncbi:hypothetical protein [Nocardioides litoris]|uniref:hypothetical protein n=1 Tax=Nocardioides litoris TaxID=1926648 RepID=UPI0014773532|nr:hypothetical protein [Nocardioides litoris]